PRRHGRGGVRRAHPQRRSRSLRAGAAPPWHHLGRARRRPAQEAVSLVLALARRARAPPRHQADARSPRDLEPREDLRISLMLIALATALIGMGIALGIGRARGRLPGGA